MNDAFREQLLKAGLATKKQVKSVAHEENVSRRKGRKKKKGGGEASSEEGTDLTSAQIAAEAKRAQDKALNEARDAAKKAAAMVAEADDLIAKNLLRDTRGEISYKFTDGTKIKSIAVTPPTKLDLADGRVGIVFTKEGYALVCRDVALKVEDRCPERLVLLNEPEELDEDDPYAAYKVPDDLVW